MIETRIPIAPDTSTTLTDETTEHIIHRKVTIQIDRDYLRKKYPELFKKLSQIKIQSTKRDKLLAQSSNEHKHNKSCISTQLQLHSNTASKK